MTASNTMIENYMMWLSDLSVLRYKLNKMADQLKALKLKLSFEGAFNNYVIISSQYQTSQKRLNNIEHRICLANNIKLNELHKRSEVTWMVTDNDADLFENMIAATRLVIDMQKSIYEGFKQTGKVPVKISVNDSSIVVSLPINKLLQVKDHA